MAKRKFKNRYRFTILLKFSGCFLPVANFHHLERVGRFLNTEDDGYTFRVFDNTLGKKVDDETLSIYMQMAAQEREERQQK